MSTFLVHDVVEILSKKLKELGFKWQSNFLALPDSDNMHTILKKVIDPKTFEGIALVFKEMDLEVKAGYKVILDGDSSSVIVSLELNYKWKYSSGSDGHTLYFTYSKGKWI